MMFALAGTAFAEGGTVSNGKYTFEDRKGNTVTVPVEAFADEVISFEHGDPWTRDSDNQDPNLTLGLPDSSNASPIPATRHNPPATSALGTAAISSSIWGFPSMMDRAMMFIFLRSAQTSKKQKLLSAAI